MRSVIFQVIDFIILLLGGFLFIYFPFNSKECFLGYLLMILSVLLLLYSCFPGVKKDV
jgi:hypothetical protein